MKNLIFILLLSPLLFFGQHTYVPDDNFEQALINLGLDDLFDNTVLTENIDTVTVLYIPYNNIADLTGIEDFTALNQLFCHNNQIVDLDVSNNANLIELNCNSNSLSSLDVRNGNNSSLWYFTAINNPNLYCIAVNDIAFANYNWVKDSGCVFSSNCSTSSINDVGSEKQLLKIIDVFGRDVASQPNTILFYLYSDGTIQKKFILK